MAEKFRELINARSRATAIPLLPLLPRSSLLRIFASVNNHKRNK